MRGPSALIYAAMSGSSGMDIQDAGADLVCATLEGRGCYSRTRHLQGCKPYMSNPTGPESSSSEPNESFGNVLSQFERNHALKPSEGTRQGTVVSVTADSVLVDI